MLIIEGNKLCTYPRCQNHLTKRCHFYLTMTKMIKNIDMMSDTWYINTALFGRRDAEIFEN